MEIVVDLHAYLHYPKHRRPTNFALYIAPASLSVDVHPDEPNFRIELFGRAPSPSSPTRRLNPDRLDQKADQFVAACFARSPQPPTKLHSAPPPHCRCHAPTADASTNQSRGRVAPGDSSNTPASPPSTQHHPHHSTDSTHGHPTANGPPSLHALWRATARAPCLVPSVASLEVCRGPPLVCALAQAWTAILIPPEPSCPDPKYRRQ